MSLQYLPSLYFASQSPRRRELLQQIGVPHLVVDAHVIEVPRTQESPRDYVQRLAREKAEAGLTCVKHLALAPKPVLGADTIVVMNNDILEKPQSQAHAAEMLRKLAGTTHQVMTAVAMVADDMLVEKNRLVENRLVEKRCEIKLSVTDVVFRPLSEQTISAYWESGEPRDKAGGYAIQGLGAVFVQQIRGSYTGVVGLPIEQTVLLLDEFAVPYWQPTARQ